MLSQFDSFRTRIVSSTSKPNSILLHALFLSSADSTMDPLYSCGKAGDMWVVGQRLWYRSHTGWVQCAMEQNSRPHHPLLPGRRLTLRVAQFSLLWLHSSSYRRHYVPGNGLYDKIFKASRNLPIANAVELPGFRSLVDKPLSSFDSVDVCNLMHAVLPFFGCGYNQDALHNDATSNPSALCCLSLLLMLLDM